MSDIKKEVLDAIVAQSLKEIQFARTYKQGKVGNWTKNEKLYYGVKTASTESRANVDLGRMQEFVHTLLSKISNPLTFKFTKRKEAQLKRVAMINSLVKFDRQRDNWDIKDLVGKKQGVIYGRAIYAYTAGDIDGYNPRLDNVDVYDFLIDPSAGGLDIERAFYLGRYGVVKSKKELEDGVKAKIYIETEVKSLLEGVGNNANITQEETNKRTRQYGQNTTGQKELVTSEKYKFWEWFTTYDGERYYVLLNESGSKGIRVCKLTDMFESGLYPFWTWACFPDLTEFWTPSYCDYVREIFMAQNVSINQMLDNAEAINKPQKVVNVGALEDLSQLKYRRDGLIYTKGDYDANKVIQSLVIPSINTPINVFDTLEKIQEKASGVTDVAKGTSDGSGKLGIYQGNQQAANERFELLNKSYSFGTSRFAKLYELGIRENLTKKIAVDLIGPDGVETVEIKRTDIFKKKEAFGTLIESSNSEVLVTIQEMQEKLKFLAANAQNPVQNPKKAYEVSAKVAGFGQEEIRELMDVSEFGSAELMSECERDIESLLELTFIKPNPWANNAYKQRMVDYLKEHQDDITPEQFNIFTLYIRAVDPIIVANEARAFADSQKKMMDAAAAEAAGTGTTVTPKNGIGLNGNNQINNNPAPKA